MHAPGEGTRLLAGEVSTARERGVTGQQLAVLVNAAVSAGASSAEAVAGLP